MKTTKITFSEWLKTLSVERLEQFDVAKGNAEAFTMEVRRYGILALDENILPDSQIQLCNAYAFIYR